MVLVQYETVVFLFERKMRKVETMMRENVIRQSHLQVFEFEVYVKRTVNKRTSSVFTSW